VLEWRNTLAPQLSDALEDSLTAPVQGCMHCFFVGRMMLGSSCGLGDCWPQHFCVVECSTAILAIHGLDCLTARCEGGLRLGLERQWILDWLCWCG